MRGGFVEGAGEGEGVGHEAAIEKLAGVRPVEGPGTDEGLGGVAEVEGLDLESTGGFDGDVVGVDGGDVDQQLGVEVFGAVGIVTPGELAEGEAVGGDQLFQLLWREGLGGGMAALGGGEGVEIERVLLIELIDLRLQ